MKRIVVVFVLIVNCVLAIAQNSSYFLDKFSQRNSLNVAFVPVNGQISFPLIGGFNYFSSSNAGLSNFLFSENSQLFSFLHSSVSGDEFINRLEPNTYFHQNLNISLLNVGLFVNQNYLSFGINVKENLHLNMPLDFFKLLKLGYKNSVNRYDLKDFCVDQDNIIEYSVGYSRYLSSKLRIGLGAKYLVGLSKLKLNYSKFDVLLTENQIKADVNGELVVLSDIFSFKKDQDNNYRLRSYNFDFTSQQPAGHGVAVDFGLEYKPIDKLTVAAAFNGIGFMNWRAGSSKIGLAQSDLNFTGFAIDNVNDVNLESQLIELEAEFKKVIHFQEHEDLNYRVLESTPSTVNLSAEYSIWGSAERDISIGFLWNSYNAPNYHRNTLMSALTFMPVSWFMFSTTYGLISKDVHKLGLAINYCPKWMNIFVASDFIASKINPQLLPIHKSSVHIQTGISFYLGK